MLVCTLTLQPKFGACSKANHKLVVLEAKTSTNTTTLCPGTMILCPFLTIRDGVKLHTKVHFGSSTPAKRPVILDRTPYNCESLQAEASVYVKAGFHFAGQDFRGRFGSGGQFTFWDHGSEDASDTFSFLQKQDWCNGHFFAIGTSADGIAAYIEAKQNPPLLGQFVIVGSPDIHGTSFQQGGFRQSLIEGWLTAIKEEAYIPQILAQEGYNAFWADQDITHEW